MKHNGPPRRPQLRKIMQIKALELARSEEIALFRKMRRLSGLVVSMRPSSRSAATAPCCCASSSRPRRRWHGHCGSEQADRWGASTSAGNRTPCRTPHNSPPSTPASCCAHTNLAAHADPAATAGLLRERPQAMLVDPTVTATDPGWTAAAEAYLRALKPAAVSEADRSLLPAIRDRNLCRSALQRGHRLL